MTSLGRKKTESHCLANFPRTISQTSYLFRQSQHKRKIRDKTRRIVHNCSDLTCKYALTEGPKWLGGGDGGGRGINVGYSLSPQSFSGCYGPAFDLCFLVGRCRCLAIVDIIFPSTFRSTGATCFKIRSQFYSKYLEPFTLEFLTTGVRDQMKVVFLFSFLIVLFISV